MSKAARSNQRKRLCDEQLQVWRTEHGVNVERLDEGQKWITFAAIQILTVVGNVAPLRRIVGYFLVHCGGELGSTLIGALVGTSDRNVRYYRNRNVEDFWQSVRSPIRGHRAPKLGPERWGVWC